MHSPGDQTDDEVKKLIEGYIKEIEVLRAKLVESEAMAETVKRMAARTPQRSSVSPMHSSMGLVPEGSSYDFATSSVTNIGDLLAEAKRDVKKMKRKARVQTISQG